MDTHIGSSQTNTTPGSVAQVQVEDLLCAVSIIPNAFGDNLPVIPSSSNVQGRNVLYHIALKAHVTQRASGQAVSGHAIQLVSNNGGDQITGGGTTDANGDATFVLESRNSGDRQITTTTPHVTLAAFALTLKEAWYESTFLITGYHVCAEDDFTGHLVNGNGLSEQHKEDFLFSARGIPMQGTGKASNGQYIALGAMNTTWALNAHGHKDHVQNESQVSFRYVDGPMGRYGPVTENHSIAVDPRVIPPGAQVDIAGVGTRSADDVGSGINGNHIDVFLGAGQAVVDSWTQGGINMTQQKVKYLGN